VAAPDELIKSSWKGRWLVQLHIQGWQCSPRCVFSILAVLSTADNRWGYPVCVWPSHLAWGEGIWGQRFLCSAILLPFNQCRVKELCLVNADARSCWAYSCIITILPTFRSREIWERVWHDEWRERSIWVDFLQNNLLLFL